MSQQQISPNESKNPYKVYVIRTREELDEYCKQVSEVDAKDAQDNFCVPNILFYVHHEEQGFRVAELTAYPHTKTYGPTINTELISKGWHLDDFITFEGTLPYINKNREHIDIYKGEKRSSSLNAILVHTLFNAVTNEALEQKVELIDFVTPEKKLHPVIRRFSQAKNPNCNAAVTYHDNSSIRTLISCHPEVSFAEVDNEITFQGNRMVSKEGITLQ